MKSKVRRGQTMVEYVLTFSALLVALSALAYLVSVTRKAVVRTENLVQSDYP